MCDKQQTVSKRHDDISGHLCCTLTTRVPAIGGFTQEVNCFFVPQTELCLGILCGVCHTNYIWGHWRLMQSEGLQYAVNKNPIKIQNGPGTCGNLNGHTSDYVFPRMPQNLFSLQKILFLFHVPVCGFHWLCLCNWCFHSHTYTYVRLWQRCSSHTTLRSVFGCCV